MTARQADLGKHVEATMLMAVPANIFYNKNYPLDIPQVMYMVYTCYSNVWSCNSINLPKNCLNVAVMLHGFMVSLREFGCKLKSIFLLTVFEILYPINESTNFATNYSHKLYLKNYMSSWKVKLISFPALVVKTSCYVGETRFKIMFQLSFLINVFIKIVYKHMM